MTTSALVPGVMPPSTTTAELEALLLAVIPTALTAVEDAFGGGPVALGLVGGLVKDVLGALPTVIDDLAAGKGLEQVRRDLDDQIVDLVESAKLGVAG